jgi:hypothetical protein
MKLTDAFIGQPGAGTYAGFYLRSNLSSTGANPQGVPFNQCPDIIQSDSEVADPSAAFSTFQSWQQSYGTAPVAGADNYYYVRSMNGAQQAGAAQASLYWAPAQVFNFPSAWKANRMATADQEFSVPLQATSDHIGVGPEPFVWNPPALPDGASYFNFIGQTAAGPTPVQVPAVGNWVELAGLIANPAFGFRNEAVVDGASAWTQRQRLSVPSSFASADLQFTLVASGFKGASVGLLCDTFTPSGQLLALLPTVVAGDGLVTGKTFPMEPGYSSSLALSCTLPAGVQLDPGASLSLVVTCPLTSGPQLDHAIEHGLVRHLALHGDVGVGPTAVAIVATLTFTVGA